MRDRFSKQALSAQPEKRTGERTEMQWILCRERLPDREMPVWLSMCDDVLKAVWRNGWCAPNGRKIGLTDGQVIAWMPRQSEPGPYREEGDHGDHWVNIAESLLDGKDGADPI